MICTPRATTGRILFPPLAALQSPRLTVQRRKRRKQNEPAAGASSRGRPVRVVGDP
jgi:hypothetical protein